MRFQPQAEITRLTLTMPSRSITARRAGGAIGHWIEQNLGAGKVTSERYMGQSSWATSHRYETDSGKKFFVKMARGQDGSMFKGEALGLQAMYGMPSGHASMCGKTRLSFLETLADHGRRPARVFLS